MVAVAEDMCALMWIQHVSDPPIVSDHDAHFAQPAVSTVVYFNGVFSFATNVNDFHQERRSAILHKG